MTDATQTEIAEFLARRDKALTELDEDYVSETAPAVPADIRLMILHKSRYEVRTIADELRHQSGQWLRERGYKRMTGEELLPDGELPA